ncbi:MAG: hypothetical protein ACOX1P_04035 [Thermoguttaceae bacterium]|jgi:hypothetical protein
MKHAASANLAALVLFSLARWCPAGEPGPGCEHLKALESLVGQRQVVFTRDGQTKPTGVEKAEWILNKNFLLHDCWGYFNEEPTRYAIATGWNPQTKEISQWVAGGNANMYILQERTGVLDPETKTWKARLQGIASGGGKHSGDLRMALAGDKVTLDLTGVREDGKAASDIHIVFSPEIDMATPAFDERPGPAYQHLKAIEWLIGDWDIRIAYPDGTSGVGGQHAEWAFNKNLIRRKGWWTVANGKRIDTLFWLTWHPEKEKIVTAGCASDGGHGTQVATYDPETKTLTVHHEAVTGAGVEISGDCRIRYVNDRQFEQVWTNLRFGNESRDGGKTVFTRK